MLGEDLLTQLNYTTIFGRYYIDTDTASEGSNIAYLFFAIDGIILVILSIYISILNKGNKKIEQEINKYRESGEIEKFNEDIENSTAKPNKKLKVLMTNKYIYNFSEELYVIPIEQISNVYTCCIIDGQISKYDYIAIETKDDMTYFIAAKGRDEKNKAFNKLLEDIKEKIK